VAFTGCGGVHYPLFENFHFFPGRIGLFMEKKVIRWKNKILHPPLLKIFVNVFSRRRADNALLRSPKYFDFLCWNQVRSDFQG
jgi:hypothetical protein